MQNSSVFQIIAIDQISRVRRQPPPDLRGIETPRTGRSIRQHGLIQPITVRPNSSGFEIVAGARRFRAAQLAELFSLPARVVELTDGQALEWALVELSIAVKLYLCVHAGPHVVVMSTTCGGVK